MKIPIGAIGRDLPAGTWTMEISAFEEVTTKEGFFALLMERETVSPTQGLSDTQTYVIGTESDPKALEDRTWLTSPDMKSLKDCLEVAGVEEVNQAEIELVDLLRAALGHRFDYTFTYVGGKRIGRVGPSSVKEPDQQTESPPASISTRRPGLTAGVKRGPGRPRKTASL